MTYSAPAIRRLFGGKLHVNAVLAGHVARAVSKLPQDVIEHITTDCWILGSVEDAWAYTFQGDELEHKHLILLSDALLLQSPRDIEWTIIHEIGHVILGHRNSILVDQTPQEIARQEEEADAFAQTYFP